MNTLAEVQERTLYFIKVRQLTMAHMFQDHLLNQVQKLSTIHNELQEWLYQISVCSCMNF